MLDRITKAMTAITAVALIWMVAGLIGGSGSHALAGTWLHPAGHSTSVQLSRTCTERVTGTPDTSRWRYEAEWTSNSCQWYLRASLECRNPFNGTTAWYHAGGWVKGRWIEDGVNCGAADPLQAGIDYGSRPGAPYRYEKLYSWSQPHLLAAHINYCNQRYYWGVNGWYQNYEAASEWDPHNYDDCWQATSVLCKDRFGTTEWVGGGWVFPALDWSGKSCPANWNPVKANINENSHCGCWAQPYFYYTYYIWPKKEKGVEVHAQR